MTDGPGKPLLHAGLGRAARRRRPRSPRELLDPSGQRLVLVVSDCVSPGWFDGRLGPVLETWGRQQPVAILQVLPERLWPSTALGLAASTELTSCEPASPNAKLQHFNPWDAFDPSWLGEEAEKPAAPRTLPMPIITLDEDSIGTWTRMIAGTGGTRTNGRLIPLDRSSSDTGTGRLDEALKLSSSELLSRFFSAATPEACRLAGLLASVPLTLPVIHLVQHTMQPDARQVHIAEVFLSGLLRQLTSTDDLGVQPDRIQFDFLDEALREELRSMVPLDESVQVFEHASRFVAGNLGQSIDFQALLIDPNAIDAIPIDGSMRPFAHLARSLLRAFGPRQAQKAEALGRRLADTEARERRASHAEAAGHVETTEAKPAKRVAAEVSMSSSENVATSRSSRITRGIPALPDPPAGFLGREEILQSLLERAFYPGCIGWLYGPPGCGLTSILLKLANQLNFHFSSSEHQLIDLIRYIDGSTLPEGREPLLKKISNLAQDDPWEWPLSSDRADWNSQNGLKALILLDRPRLAPSELVDFINDVYRSGGAVVVATDGPAPEALWRKIRETHTEAPIQQKAIGGLDSENAVLLFRRVAGLTEGSPKDPGDAVLREFCLVLEGLPLPLVLVAQFFRSGRFSFDVLLEALQSAPHDNWDILELVIVHLIAFLDDAERSVLRALATPDVPDFSMSQTMRRSGLDQREFAEAFTRLLALELVTLDPPENVQRKDDTVSFWESRPSIPWPSLRHAINHNLPVVPARPAQQPEEETPKPHESRSTQQNEFYDTALEVYREKRKFLIGSWISIILKELRSGARLNLIGPRGSGKTTLLRLIEGEAREEGIQVVPININHERWTGDDAILRLRTLIGRFPPERSKGGSTGNPRIVLLDDLERIPQDPKNSRLLSLLKLLWEDNPATASNNVSYLATSEHPLQEFFHPLLAETAQQAGLFDSFVPIRMPSLSVEAGRAWMEETLSRLSFHPDEFLYNDLLNQGLTWGEFLTSCVQRIAAQASSPSSVEEATTQPPHIEGEDDLSLPELSPPASMADAEALARFGDAAIPYLLYQPEMEESQAAACVRTLSLIGTPRGVRGPHGLSRRSTGYCD